MDRVLAEPIRISRVTSVLSLPPMSEIFPVFSLGAQFSAQAIAGTTREIALKLQQKIPDVPLSVLELGPQIANVIVEIRTSMLLELKEAEKEIVAAVDNAISEAFVARNRVEVIALLTPKNKYVEQNGEESDDMELELLLSELLPLEFGARLYQLLGIPDDDGDNELA